MIVKQWLSACLIASTLVTLPALAQVDVNFIVNTPPPPMRVERMPSARSGYIWAPGYWNWQRGRYVWVGGSWMRERPGYRWVPQHWYNGSGDRSYRFAPGVWQRDTQWRGGPDRRGSDNWDHHRDHDWDRHDDFHGHGDRGDWQGRGNGPDRGDWHGR